MKNKALVWVSLGFAAGCACTALVLGLRVPETPSAREPSAQTKSSGDSRQRVGATSGSADAAGPSLSDTSTSKKPTLAEGRAARRAERDSKLIAWFRETYTADYARLFTELGVPANQHADLIEHATELYRAKLEVRKYTTDMLFAQQEYKERLKGLLGDRYSDYLRFEDMRPAREESQLISQYFAEAGTPFGKDLQSVVERVIHESPALSLRTRGSLGGPLGDPPPQGVGKDRTVAYLEAQQADLSLNAQQALALARTAGVGATELGLLERYFEKQVRAIDDAINQTGFVTPYNLARFEAELETYRRSPDATAEQIRRREARIAWFRQQLAAPKN